MKQRLYFTNDIVNKMEELCDEFHPSNVIIFTDDNVDELVIRPRLKSGFSGGPIESAAIITDGDGEEKKTLDEVKNVWEFFQENNVTRSSLIFNIGGGVVTDMGGFAAACFKRGVRFVNIPTTILAAVDAATGGKTGVNFNGFKNEIGAFCPAEAVIVSSSLFDSLPDEERLSGFAEMIKHAMLSSRADFDEILGVDVLESVFDENVWLPILEKSVAVKQRIVEQDPTEKGLRKVLNLGHTAGHAFESLALRRKEPVPHGYAVAWGLVVATILSHEQFDFPSAEINRLARFVKEKYGIFHFTCDDYPEILSFMHHDKKNESSDRILFTLLEDYGRPHINCEVDDENVKVALDLFRDLFGI